MIRKIASRKPPTKEIALSGLDCRDRWGLSRHKDLVLAWFVTGSLAFTACQGEPQRSRTEQISDSLAKEAIDCRKTLNLTKMGDGKSLAKADTTRDCLEIPFSRAKFAKLAEMDIQKAYSCRVEGCKLNLSRPRYLSIKRGSDTDGYVFVQYPFADGVGTAFSGYLVVGDSSQNVTGGQSSEGYFGLLRDHSVFLYPSDGFANGHDTFQAPLP